MAKEVLITLLLEGEASPQRVCGPPSGIDDSLTRLTLTQCLLDADPEGEAGYLLPVDPQPALPASRGDLTGTKTACQDGSPPLSSSARGGGGAVEHVGVCFAFHGPGGIRCRRSLVSLASSGLGLLRGTLHVNMAGIFLGAGEPRRIKAAVDVDDEQCELVRWRG